MLARIRKSMQERDQGFTLIELLVVMIIIGILAAIAIPVFLNQRAAARDTAVKSDVTNIGKEVAAYYVDGEQPLASIAAPGTGQIGYVLTFGTGADADVLDTEIVPSDGVTVPAANSVAGTDDTNWCVALTHADGRVKTFNYSAGSGLGESVCP